MKLDLTDIDWGIADRLCLVQQFESKIIRAEVPNWPPVSKLRKRIERVDGVVVLRWPMNVEDAEIVHAKTFETFVDCVMDMIRHEVSRSELYPKGNLLSANVCLFDSIAHVGFVFIQPCGIDVPVAHL